MLDAPITRAWAAWNPAARRNFSGASWMSRQHLVPVEAAPSRNRPIWAAGAIAKAWGIW